MNETAIEPLNVQQLLDEATTITIMGQKKSGKTYCGMYIGNEIKDKPVFYFDTVKAITESGVCNTKNIIKITRQSLNRPKLIYDTLDKCYASGGAIIQLNKLVPRDLVDFSDMFCCWAMEKGNMALFVDEVADYCPQSVRYYSEELERLWRDGRNYGIKPVGLITQRSQAANKNLLALADVYIVFRMFHNLDRGKVKDLIGVKPDHWEKFERDIMSLEQRHAFLFETSLDLRRVIIPKMVSK